MGHFHLLIRAVTSDSYLFGQQGRTSTYRANRIKHELMGTNYNPREDTCVKACVRLLASAATQTVREDAASGEDAAGRSG